MELKTAKEWGLTPSQWDELDEADKAQMIALEETSATMQAYEQQLQDDELERTRAKRKPVKK